MQGEKRYKATVAQNKKAFFDYFIGETFEAGIALKGAEIKSVRKGSVNLRDSFVSLKNEEANIIGMHIATYEKSGIWGEDPTRRRKLLLHKNEIRKLIRETTKGNFAIIPLKMYIKGPFAKIQIGICSGKKKHDKRQELAKKDANRNMQRAIKEMNRF